VQTVVSLARLAAMHSGATTSDVLTDITSLVLVVGLLEQTVHHLMVVTK
tara:strand:- start:1973 stop:2119 length:147 start_codon:yes stop_codon:yes gene_type:complete